MKRLREFGLLKGLSKIIIFNESNQAWVSGLRIAGSALIIDLRDSVVRYYTPILEFWRAYDMLGESLGSEISYDVLGYYRYKIDLPEDIKVFNGGLKDAIKSEVGDLGEKSCGVDNIDIDSDLRDLLRKCVDLREDIASLRSIKNNIEISLIKTASEISMKALRRIIEEGVIGRSEREIAGRFSYLIRLYGADGEAFPSIIAVNENASKPHYQPSSRVVSLGDYILVDAGAKVREYNSDMTRMIIYRNSEDYKHVLEAVIESVDAALEKISPGAKASDIDKAAREVLERRGYSKYFIHSTGHGVGVDVHEKPLLSLSSSDSIEEGMIVTIEPGIYMRNKIGVRVEELVLVSSRGPRILTEISRILEYF
ncbi:MAG: M24 family metallopeptidase [Sulfolobales archaeon]